MIDSLLIQELMADRSHKHIVRLLPIRRVVALVLPCGDMGRRIPHASGSKEGWGGDQAEDERTAKTVDLCVSTVGNEPPFAKALIIFSMDLRPDLMTTRLQARAI